jgi:hypothetical protein
MSKICNSFVIIFSLLVAAGSADAGVIDFEGLADEDLVTTQFSALGATFSGQTVVLQAGSSLNELEFPPHSGVNVASSDLGQINVAFAAPPTTVGAFFTHSSPVTFTAFNAQNVIVDTKTITGDNTVSSGNPNEFISTSSPGGIAMVTIAGVPTEFTIDDLTFSSAVPEPDLAFVGLGLLGLAVAASRVRPTHRPR